MASLADLFVVLSVQTEAWTAGLDEAASAGEDFTASFTEALAGINDALDKITESVSAMSADATGSFGEVDAAADTGTEAIGGLGDSAATAREALAALGEAATGTADAVSAAADATTAETDAATGLKDAAAGASDAVGALSDVSARAAAAQDAVATATAAAADGAKTVTGAVGDAATAGTAYADAMARAAESGATFVVSGDGVVEAVKTATASLADASDGATSYAEAMRAAAGASADASLALARSDAILADAQKSVETSSIEQDAALRQQSLAQKQTADDAEASASKFHLLGLAALAAAAVSVKMAANFQTSMNKLVTSAGETQKNLGMVSQGILQLSSSTNTSVSQLSSGMYLIESAGFHGASGLTVLKAAAEGAQAEGASLATVSNAVTSALNSYGMKASSAMSVTNEMVTAVGQGKMTMEQLAGSLAAVLPVASAAHLSFAQVGGSIATMTSQGMSAEWAAQDLRHTITSLQNPNQVQIAEMQQLGINSNALAKNLGKAGLTGTINQISDSILHSMGPSGMVLLKSFNDSKLAAQSATEEIAAMPKSIQGTAKAYLNGTMSVKSWQALMYQGSLPATAKNLLSQFATTANAAHGFNSQLKAGGGDAQTFTAAMSKVMGGQVGLQTALMVGGGHMATYKANVDAVAKSAAHTGSNINNWKLIQSSFNFQLGSAEKAVEAVGYSFGGALLPAATKAMHVIADVASFLAHCSIASKGLAIVIGVLLAGAITKGLMSAIKTSLGGFKDLASGMQGAVGFFRAGEDGVSGFGKAMGGLKSAWGAVSGLFTASEAGMEAEAGATDVATEAQEGFNLAVLANPITIALVAIVALAAGFYLLYTHCKTVRDAVADVGKFFASAWQDACKAAGAVVQWFVGGPLAWIKAQLALFTEFWQQHGQQIEEIAKTIWGLISDIIKGAISVIMAIIHSGISVIQAAWNAGWAIVSSVITVLWPLISGIVKAGLALISGYIKAYMDIITAVFKAAWDIISGVVKITWTIIAGVIHAAIQLVLGIIGVALDLMTGHWSKAWHDLVTTTDNLIHDVVNIIKSVTSDFGTMLLSAGRALVEGLIHGIESMGGAAMSAVKSLASGVLHSAMSFLGIHSPSTVFAEIGENITKGLASGITMTMQQAVDASRKLAEEVNAAYNDGQITAAEATTYMSDLSSDLDARKDKLVTAMAKIGLEMRAGLISSITDATTASSVSSAVGKLATYVQDAWSAGDITKGKASSLTTFIEADNGRLQTLATQRAKIAADIKTADTYATTTASNTESWAGISNITSSMTTGGMTYSGNILAGMKADLTSINQFNTALKKLAKLGLSKNLINQIVQMGPSTGLQVAQSLLDGPVSVIKSMNTTQAAITTGSNALGATAADAMYDSGSAAGKGFLSGLEAQQKNITALMSKIASSMVTTIKKELKISSPSQVTAEHGKMVAAGLAQGMETGIPLVTSAATRMARAAVPSAGAITGAAGGAGGGRQQITINLTVNGFIGTSQQLVTEIYNKLQEEALQHNRRNGTNGLSLPF